jgi:glycosyltransferase involved in cell wall biosynthesis
MENAPPKLSVVIPTYNRCAILEKTLGAYLTQTACGEILEIIVVDDGSTDETGELVSRFAKTCPVPIRYLRQENSGRAAARNRAIRQAAAQMILFGDDDIVPTPRMVAEHLAWHVKYPDPSVAIVGPAYWSPDLPPTPMMKWWGLNGIRFDFPHMKADHEVSWAVGAFWNTSVKLRFLQEKGIFDERFRAYGFEDSELTYRLNKKGYRAIYNPNAIGYHYKRAKFSDMCCYRKTLATTPNLPIYLTTEPGRLYWENQIKRRETRKYRVQKWATQVFVPILFPLKPILDSRIPLPGFIYSAFLAYYGSFDAEKHRVR